MTHTRTRQRLFLFHRRLGAQPAANVLFHAPHPALGVGEHPVGFQNLPLLLVGSGKAQHLVHADAQFIHGRVQPLHFALRIVGNRVHDHHTRLVQPDVALGHALLAGRALDHHRMAVAGGHRGALAHKGAQLGHLGQHHRDDFQRINLVSGKFARILGLHDQHAQRLAQALHGNAQKT